MIHQLSSTTINQIAAGEIVVGPQNALKELIENSIDANATRIDVITKDGGVKLLQVTDNGSGIAPDDLKLLCRRWCTSKIDTHDDLRTLTSFGFRGEALASISHVGHVTVITKKKEDAAASRAKYELGEISEQTLQAGNTGTQITVQDLFFNTPQRLRALNKADCHTKCVDLVSRYGIHNEAVEFSFRRQNDSSMLFTLKGSKRDRIRVVYGSRVSGSLVDIDGDNDIDQSLLTNLGLSKPPVMLISNPNYSNTKSNFIIFINNRLVTCEPIKKALVAVYSRYLPTKSFPFVYLSLFIDPENLDVNVHPTKQEVRFLHQAEIVEFLSNLVDDKLSNIDESRVFDVVDAKKVSSTQKPSASQYPHSQNRTDYSQMHLPFKKVKLSESGAVDLTQFKSGHEETRDQPREDVSSYASQQLDSTQPASQYQLTRLKSIHALYNEYTASYSALITQIIKYHVFVGVVDPEKRLCCIQYELQLLLVDYARLSNDFFYQRALQGFNNYGTFDLSFELTNVWTEEQREILLQNKDMLAEYFNIRFEDSKLVTLPSLLSGYTPDVAKLGVFIAQLAKCNFDNEKNCFDDVCHVIANLFTLSVDQSAQVTRLFQKMRDQYIAHSSVEEGVVVVTSMPSLYKVFERC
ncbi:putative MutL protein-like protein 1 [Yarrowia sp. C11]|nr:putative MutL protein-like protein 1 [Yarrowia sp. E02]KAG5373412.1 putative MutL protein-like protein 1 [Yarrowia sp. C11]